MASVSRLPLVKSSSLLAAFFTFWGCFNFGLVLVYATLVLVALNSSLSPTDETTSIMSNSAVKAVSKAGDRFKALSLLSTFRSIAQLSLWLLFGYLIGLILAVNILPLSRRVRIFLGSFTAGGKNDTRNVSAESAADISNGNKQANRDSVLTRIASTSANTTATTSLRRGVIFGSIVMLFGLSLLLCSEAGRGRGVGQSEARSERGVTVPPISSTKIKNKVLEKDLWAGHDAQERVEREGGETKSRVFKDAIAFFTVGRLRGGGDDGGAHVPAPITALPSYLAMLGIEIIGFSLPFTIASYFGSIPTFFFFSPSSVNAILFAPPTTSTRWRACFIGVLVIFIAFGSCVALSVDGGTLKKGPLLPMLFSFVTRRVEEALRCFPPADGRGSGEVTSDSFVSSSSPSSFSFLCENRNVPLTIFVFSSLVGHIAAMFLFFPCETRNSYEGGGEAKGPTRRVRDGEKGRRRLFSLFRFPFFHGGGGRGYSSSRLSSKAKRAALQFPTAEDASIPSLPSRATTGVTTPLAAAQASETSSLLYVRADDRLQVNYNTCHGSFDVRSRSRGTTTSMASVGGGDGQLLPSQCSRLPMFAPFSGRGAAAGLEEDREGGARGATSAGSPLEHDATLTPASTFSNDQSLAVSSSPCVVEIEMGTIKVKRPTRANADRQPQQIQREPEPEQGGRSQEGAINLNTESKRQTDDHGRPLYSAGSDFGRKTNASEATRYDSVGYSNPSAGAKSGRVELTRWRLCGLLLLSRDSWFFILLFIFHGLSLLSLIWLQSSLGTEDNRFSPSEDLCSDNTCSAENANNNGLLSLATREGASRAALSFFYGSEYLLLAAFSVGCFLVPLISSCCRGQHQGKASGGPLLMLLTFAVANMLTLCGLLGMARFESFEDITARRLAAPEQEVQGSSQVGDEVGFDATGRSAGPPLTLARSTHSSTGAVHRFDVSQNNRRLPYTFIGNGQSSHVGDGSTVQRSRAQVINNKEEETVEVEEGETAVGQSTIGEPINSHATTSTARNLQGHQRQEDNVKGRSKRKGESGGQQNDKKDTHAKNSVENRATLPPSQKNSHLLLGAQSKSKAPAMEETTISSEKLPSRIEAAVTTEMQQTQGQEVTRTRPEARARSKPHLWGISVPSLLSWWPPPTSIQQSDPEASEMPFARSLPEKGLRVRHDDNSANKNEDDNFRYTAWTVLRIVLALSLFCVGASLPLIIEGFSSALKVRAMELFALCIGLTHTTTHSSASPPAVAMTFSLAAFESNLEFSSLSVLLMSFLIGLCLLASGAFFVGSSNKHLLLGNELGHRRDNERDQQRGEGRGSRDRPDDFRPLGVAARTTTAASPEDISLGPETLLPASAVCLTLGVVCLLILFVRFCVRVFMALVQCCCCCWCCCWPSSPKKPSHTHTRAEGGEGERERSYKARGAGSRWSDYPYSYS